jgi:hypothetical protein
MTKLIDYSNKYFLFSADWDWRWFGFELSYNGHDKYFNICITWLSINIYVGRF